jgi:hypothetical protein
MAAKPVIKVVNKNTEQILVHVTPGMKRELVAEAQARDKKLGPHVRSVLRDYLAKKERDGQ